MAQKGPDYPAVGGRTGPVVFHSMNPTSLPVTSRTAFNSAPLVFCATVFPLAGFTYPPTAA